MTNLLGVIHPEEVISLDNNREGPPRIVGLIYASFRESASFSSLKFSLVTREFKSRRTGQFHSYCYSSVQLRDYK